MGDLTEDNSKQQIDAGRGVAKNQNLDTDKNTTENQADNSDRLDDRVRKAGY